jgi:hypothetical protein
VLGELADLVDVRNKDAMLRTRNKDKCSLFNRDDEISVEREGWVKVVAMTGGGGESFFWIKVPLYLIFFLDS